MSSLLEVHALKAGYGSGVVLSDVSFSVAQGQCMALLGRNGVGKSTLIETLMGNTSIRSGSIRVEGRELARASPAQRAAAGLGWVPQEREVFPSLSVRENLTVVARRGPWTLSRVYALFPRLQERERNLGSQLSGGEQQMLAIGRALMTNPKLLLLDEPMEGLAPIIVEELARSIARMVREHGLSAILVEQHPAIALRLASTALVLERGCVTYGGASDALLEDPLRLHGLLALSSEPRAQRTAGAKKA